MKQLCVNLSSYSAKMLEARLVNASVLKRVVEAMKELVTDATFEFSDAGLRLQAMDSSHVSLCYLNLQNDSFDFYRCDKSQAVSLSLPNLAKVLKCANDKDTLTIKMKENDDALSLLIESCDQERIMEFEIKLMDIDQEQLEIPETEYDSSIEIQAVEFRKIVSDLKELGDTCDIGCKKEGVYFQVEGDIGKSSITLKPTYSADDDTRTVINVQEPVFLRFALRYLNLFAKATPLSRMVKIKMAKDVPLLVEYSIGQAGSLCFYLAPKIDDGDAIKVE